MNQIINLLKTSDPILLATHKNPDGDAIGSLLALGIALETMGKTAHFFCESNIPAVYQFLQGVNRVIHQLPGSDCGTALVLDCGNIERLGEAAEDVKRFPVIINIDHHATNTGFGHYKYIDVDACASAEIVYQIITAMAVPISKAIATAIYTGILTDTGSFRFTNTNQAAFAICQEMVAKGVDPSSVARHVYGTYSMGRLKLLNLALDSIEISPDGKVSWMALTQEMMKETGTQPEDADGIINYARRIEDVKVAILIQELGGNGNGGRNRKTPYHVSLRSDGSVDVSTIASAFGGGGHVSAAGFNTDASLSDLKSQILKMTESI